MSETIIHMAPTVREQVLARILARVCRPGHRDYQQGPAMILFQDGVRIPIRITSVEHTVAEGQYKHFMSALRRLDLPAPDGDKITVINFELEATA